MFILKRIQHVERVNFIFCDFTGIEDAFKKAKLDLRTHALDVEHNQGIDFQGLINWIGHFLHLTGLTMNHRPDKMDDMAIIYPERAPKINMSALRKVVKLSTLNVDGPMLWGNQLGQMLKNCPKVTKLSLFNQTLYDDGFSALTKLFSDLTHVRLAGCDRVRPWMVKILLNSCPRLVSLYSPLFDVDYMFDPEVCTDQRSWPCTALKVLIVQEVVWTSTAKRLKSFMKQIGSLKKLEVIQFEYVDREEEELRVVLPASVRSARKDLKVTLEEGHFMRKDLQQSVSLKWVLDVWPKMRVLSIMP